VVPIGPAFLSPAEAEGFLSFLDPGEDYKVGGGNLISLSIQVVEFFREFPKEF
jgi:hypothetical protein